jgi:hypothetical protein
MWHIKDNIYLGNASDAVRHECFVKLNNIYQSNPDKKYLTLNVALDLDTNGDCKVGLIDGPGNPLYRMVTAIETLHSMTSSGKDILVHCHEGRSRSVTVIALYLAMCQGGTFMDNLEMVRRIRTDTNVKPAMIKLAEEVYRSERKTPTI